MAQLEDLGHGHQMGLGSSYDARNFPGRPVVKTVSRAGGSGAIPNKEIKIPDALQQGQKKKKL